MLLLLPLIRLFTLPNVDTTLLFILFIKPVALFFFELFRPVALEILFITAVIGLEEFAEDDPLLDGDLLNKKNR